MFKYSRHALSLDALLLSLVELGVLFFASMWAHTLRLETPPRDEQLIGSLVVAISFSIGMISTGMYAIRPVAIRGMTQRFVAAGVIAVLIISAVAYAFQEIYVGRGVVLYSAVIGLLGVLLVRFAYLGLTENGLSKRRILVVGSRDECAKISRAVKEDLRFKRIQIVGCIELDAPDRNEESEVRLDRYSLQTMVRKHRIEEIVIAIRERRGGVLPLRELVDCKLSGARILDLTSFYEREVGMLPIDGLRASWLLAADGFNTSLWRDASKRAFDIVVGVMLLVLTLPIMIIAAAAVLIESGFPVIYRQQRVGEGGRTFSMFKLRSMWQHAEALGGAQWAQINDPRITRVGGIIRAMHIDELPQIFNVLRGEMSFVGPRPERLEFVDRFRREVQFYEVRHSVKPGVTGWAQISYHYGASLADTITKLEYDLYYVKNHSLALDFLILIETLEVVFLRRGAR